MHMTYSLMVFGILSPNCLLQRGRAVRILNDACPDLRDPHLGLCPVRRHLSKPLPHVNRVPRVPRRARIFGRGSATFRTEDRDLRRAKTTWQLGAHGLVCRFWRAWVGFITPSGHLCPTRPPWRIAHFASGRTQFMAMRQTHAFL